MSDFEKDFINDTMEKAGNLLIDLKSRLNPCEHLIEDKCNDVSSKMKEINELLKDVTIVNEFDSNTIRDIDEVLFNLMNNTESVAVRIVLDKVRETINSVFNQ